MRRTSWPRAASRRPTWCAPAQASRPIRQGGRLARRSSSWPRASFWRQRILPCLSMPIRWKTFLPRSMPMVVTRSCRVLLVMGVVSAAFVVPAFPYPAGNTAGPCHYGVPVGADSSPDVLHVTTKRGDLSDGSVRHQGMRKASRSRGTIMLSIERLWNALALGGVLFALLATAGVVNLGDFPNWLHFIIAPTIPAVAAEGPGEAARVATTQPARVERQSLPESGQDPAEDDTLAAHVTVEAPTFSPT